MYSSDVSVFFMFAQPSTFPSDTDEAVHNTLIGYQTIKSLRHHQLFAAVVSWAPQHFICAYTATTVYTRRKLTYDVGTLVIFQWWYFKDKMQYILRYKKIPNSIFLIYNGFSYIFFGYFHVHRTHIVFFSAFQYTLIKMKNYLTKETSENSCFFFIIFLIWFVHILAFPSCGVRPV